MRMSLTGQKYHADRRCRAVAARLASSVCRAFPASSAAAATCCVPLEGGYGLPFRIIGRPLEKGPFHGGGAWLTVSSGYFDVFKIPIKRGRAFTDRDDACAPGVVIINEAMAKQYWKDKDPLDERIMIGAGVMKELSQERERQIIGVASDVRDGGLNNEPGPHMYVPNAQVPDALNALNVRITPVAWVVRTQGEPYGVSNAIQEQLRQASGLPVSDMRSMEEVVSRSISRQRFNVLLMTRVRCVGAAAGGDRHLRADGVLSRAAHAGDRHPHGAGRRSAAGAPDGRLPGHAAGDRSASSSASVAALGLTRLMASFLFGCRRAIPAVFIVMPVVLTLVSMIAVWLPARRASTVNPLVALRYE